MNENYNVRSCQMKTDQEEPSFKRRRKSLHITDNLNSDFAGFIDILDSKSVILPDKRPNMSIKDLEYCIKSVYNIPGPDCFIMNGEEYSGDRCLHELTRDKYLYVPFQSAVDVEVKFFSLGKNEILISSLKSMNPSQMESLDRKVIERIKYGVHIINFYKKKAPKSQNNATLQAYIPQILRGNTCDDANEAKIDELMRHRYKSTPINLKQNILHFKQTIEAELLINLDKVDVYDLYKFQKLPEQLPLSTFITMVKDYNDFILSFRFKQVPKLNTICIVINQVIPVHVAPLERSVLPSLLSPNPPDELFLPSLDQNKQEKEQWKVLATFSHGCKKESPKDWTALEMELWLNYIRTTLSVIPKDQLSHQMIRNEPFHSVISKDRILSLFKTNVSGNVDLIMARFYRHCDLLLKYKLFYQFIQHVSQPPPRVCSNITSNAPPKKGPFGRSKAQREEMVSKHGGRREVQFSSKNLMETKLGQSLYAGKNSTCATTKSQFQHRKWTFFLKYLIMPEYANQVAWVDYEGGFRLMNQDSISRLYGQTCNKPDMTYDKLSRGLRYDRSGLIDKADKSYCWKFTVPIEEVLGLSVDVIIKKMYKYYKKRDTTYPGDLLLKESTVQRKSRPIGHMVLLRRDPEEVAMEERIEALVDGDKHESCAKLGYMSTDRRINFWVTADQTSPERYYKRLMQGRLVHSVLPNEPEFIALTCLNDNKSVIENRPWMHEHNKDFHAERFDPFLGELAPRLRNDSLTNDTYQYLLATNNFPTNEVEEELVSDYFYDNVNLNCLD